VRSTDAPDDRDTRCKHADDEAARAEAGGVTDDTVTRLRRQNHEHAERRDREMAELRSKVAKYENAYHAAKERVRGTPVDWMHWTTDAAAQEPDGWWRYTSQITRDVLMAAALDTRAAEPGLDVERLARTLSNVLRHPGVDNGQRLAKQIAAEYDRLASEDKQPA
jgi:hypothetical protein